MKNIAQILFSLCSLFVLMFFQTFTGQAQTDRIGDFIRAGREDAEAFTRAYLEPLPNGFGGNLNSGWYNSASTHSTLGFDIQIRGALAFVPSSDQEVDITTLDLQNVELVEGESPFTPTAAGSDSEGPEIIVRDDDGNEVDRFNLPQGSGLNFVPAPMIQASVGLIKNTDVTVRFVPTVNIDDYGDFNQKGIGIKHSLSQWLPGRKLLPVDISIFAGYNRIDINANLDVDPQSDAIQTDPDPNYEDQKIETTFDTFTARLIVGKDLPFISFYGAVGYETSTMNLDVTGEYPVAFQEAGQKFTRSVEGFSYSESGDNDFSLTGGLNFKIFFFNIFGEYTLAKYPVANAGIGFSFR